MFELISETAETMIVQPVLYELEKQTGKLAIEQEKGKTNWDKVRPLLIWKSKFSNFSSKENDKKRKLTHNNFGEN